MRKLLLFACICMFSSSIFAQLSSPITLGAHAGLVSTKIDTKIPTLDNVKDKFDNGMMLGVFARLNLGKWYVQPELNYVSRKSKAGDIDLKMKSLDIPVLLGYKIVKLPAFNLRAFAGPVASFSVDDNLKEKLLELKDSSVKDTAKGAVWNAKLGVGVDFLKLTLDVDYEFGLTDVSSEFLKKHKMFNVTLGFKIL